MSVPGSGVRGDRLHVFCGTFGGDLLDVAAFGEGGERVFGEAAGLTPFADDGADVFPEGRAETLLGLDELGLPLEFGQLFEVDERGFGIEFFGGGDRLDHGFDLAFEIVALVDHEGNV